MKFNRPPFLLVIPGDHQGCGWHRCRKPAEVIARTGYAAARVSLEVMDDRSLTALNPDVIVFQQRLNFTKEIDRHRNCCPKAFFVYELDDALSAVPEASWHHPHMLPDIDDRTKQCILHCDAVTVSTEDLRDHLYRFIPHSIPIRVAPNMLGRDDIEIAMQMRKQVQTALPPKTKRLRIGWGGGAGHAGDLKIIEPVMRHFGDDIEWFFLGMLPDIAPEIHKTFIGAATPDRYLPTLSAMNADIIIAPLEDHLFNRCKSNLRILESGACLYPIIASPVAPYKTKNPPIAYAESTEDWIRQITSFIDMTESEREAKGSMLNAWVRGSYVLDDHAEERVKNWLPNHSRIFKPHLNYTGTGFVTSIEDIKDCDFIYPRLIEGYDNIPDLKEACLHKSSDILYIRAGATVLPETIEALRNSTADVIAPFSNDGGPWGFPTTASFAPLDPDTAEKIQQICLAHEPGFIPTGAVVGPVILLRRKVLAAIGCPDFDTLPVEVAILEWSVIAKSRGFSTGIATNAFSYVIHPGANQVDTRITESASIRIGNRWPRNSNDEAGLIAFRQKLEIEAHKACYKQLPPENRSDYTQWTEACDSFGPKAIEKADILYSFSDLKILTNEYSIFNNSSCEALSHQWYFFIPDGAEVSPVANAYIADAIVKNPNAMIFYGDHDYISTEGKRVSPDLKPNFDFYMALSRDYLSQAIVIRSDLIEDQIEGDVKIREEYLYDLALTICIREGRDKIHHIPHVLSHLAPLTMETATRPLAAKLTSVEKVISEAKLGIEVKAHPLFPGLRMLSFSKAAYEANPHVTIIIPTKNKTEMLIPCIQTISRHTKYKNYDILIIDNGSDDPKMLEYLESLHNADGIQVLKWPHPYNWSSLNNFAVDHAIGEVLLFLNDDTRVMSADWLSEMVGASLLPNIGTVGARLIYPSGHIQHVGVIASGGITGHMHKGLPPLHPGYCGIACISHEATAVTGACMLVTKKVFEELGRFDESLPTNFNDVAFCKTSLKKGYFNLVSIQSELQHIEGFTRNHEVSKQTFITIRDEGIHLNSLHPEVDHYWNPNLNIFLTNGGKFIGGMNCDIYAFPPPSHPWEDPPPDHILLIGPKEPLENEVHDHAAIFSLSVAGNYMSITAPAMTNCGPWDLRFPAPFALAMKDLGIDRIVITKLGEFSTRILNFFLKLDLPIKYCPIDAEAVCPRGNMQTIEEGKLVSCNRGYANGKCDSCLMEHSSPQGLVNRSSWLMDWSVFLADPHVTFSPENLDDESIKAFSFLFHVEE